MTRALAQLTTPSTNASIDSLALDLQDLLQKLVIAHEQLLVFAAAREKALATFSMADLALGVKRENAVVAEVAKLERERSEVVGRLLESSAASGVTPKSAPVTIHAIAPLLSREREASVLAVAAQLRERIETLHAKNAALKVAAATLAAHSQGLLREACSRLNHSGAYCARGTVNAGPPVLTAIDVTT